MNRRSLGMGDSTLIQPLEWDSNMKEQWFFEFEQEPINDDKWSCIVTAAVQNETQDEECIQTYIQCVNSELRRALKVISMSDVVKLLKNNNGGSKKEEKISKTTRKSPSKARTQRFTQVVELAAKYATYTATECKLPPELMAAVLKYMILGLKEESCLRKRMDVVRERKIREQRIKAKFIRDLKPYEAGQEEVNYSRRVLPNILELEEPIDDEPIVGPDLYIMLTDFYNVLYFPELQSLNVPFVAILRISTETKIERGINSELDLEVGKRRSTISNFWEKLNEEYFVLANPSKFKDIAVVDYEAPINGSKDYYRVVFDELAWTQYSAYSIYRQHRKYLQQLHVQRIVLSFETLDLSKCEVYNMMCDSLVTGEPVTPLLVLYAMVEQVVVGVPHTESVAVEYEQRFFDFLNSPETFSESSDKSQQVVLVTPCMECRSKVYESPCDKLKQQTDSNSQISEEEEWIETSEETSISTQRDENPSKSTQETVSDSSAAKTYKSLIAKVQSERKTEKEIREDKRWKTPSLCFYGDSIFLQTYFCDPRLFDQETIVDRFLKNSSLPLIWRNYPELSPMERAYSNFHLNTLLKMTQLSEEVLKLHIYFTLAMNLIGRTYEGGSRTGLYEADKRGLSDLKLNQSLLSLLKGEERNFRSYFLRTFIAGLYFRKIGVQTEDVILGSDTKTESYLQSNRVTITSQTPSSHDDERQFDGATSSTDEKMLINFYSVLNCFQISNLTDSDTPNTETFYNLIQDFKFYESLEPNLMLQRLVESQDNFNSKDISYFTPTDTLVLLLYNDYDGRGIFCQSDTGVILAPVGLRDFYLYVYPEITSWLVEEEEEHAKFMSELADKARAKEEKKDAEFLSQLKKKYCTMSEDKRKEFLLGDVGKPSPDVKEKELGELPFKPKPRNPDRISFFVTNMTDVRVETEGNVQEFFSPDGTQVRASIDSWLYDPLQLLRLRVKRCNFSLYYNQWLEHVPATNFTFKTNSDIIFSFCKDDDSVTISWPTGLIIRPVPLVSGLYIRQSYLKPYRAGWEIEEEKSRCFLRNGQLLIFKNNGDYDILFGSGTKYSFCQSTVPRYEIISTTGEVWQVRTKGPCKNKKTLMTVNKIFLGVDPNTKETFYKREDGTCCMLWPNGRLVTSYPDGTKMTTTPYFEKEEVTTDWTEEEKLYYEELESKYRQEQEPRSKTILRNSSTPRTAEEKVFTVTGFVMVSCTYLTEHPKYSTVCFNSNDPFVKLRMPEDITVLLSPEGIYEVQQDKNFLKVDDTAVEFYMECPDCKEKSTVKLYLDTSDLICKCIDYFQHAFFVYRNGRTEYQEYYRDADFDQMAEYEEQSEKSQSTVEKCGNAHLKSQSLMRRCFAFERDMSGVEFLHMGSLSCHFYHLPEETHFELNTEDVANICHTSNSPYYKVGYEKWVMDYEDNNNSLPTNLKKKDMKELGVKQVTRNTFKFPFPKHHNCGSQPQNDKIKRIVEEPKVIISRTIKCLSQNPSWVMERLRENTAEYQEKAVKIFNQYRKHKVVDDRTSDARYVEMRLKKIALTLSQSLHMYPHLCTNLPSTEKDIHYFGHFIHAMQSVKNHTGDGGGMLPNCRQIPPRLPRSSEFSSICEENESPRLT